MDTLYEQDYALWIDDVVQKLQQRDFEHINWENLIEEVADLSGSQRREIKSRLRILLCHLLKRSYVTLPECYRGWEITLTDQRAELQFLLEDSPSLWHYFLAVVPKIYKMSLKDIKKEYPQFVFPEEMPYSSELLLNTPFGDE